MQANNNFKGLIYMFLKLSLWNRKFFKKLFLVESKY